MYGREFERIRVEKTSEIESIAQLKAGQIGAWRDERIQDAMFGARSPFLVTALRRSEAGRATAAERALITERLDDYLATYRYDHAFIVGLDGRVSFSDSTQSSQFGGAEREAVLEALAQRRTVMSHFFVAPDRGARISAAAPILDGNRALGVLVLRRDPEIQIFPLLRRWPSPSGSAETTLLARVEDAMVFVTGPRHQDMPPLGLRIPMSDASSAGVRAVQKGAAVTVEGQDYRGVDVIAHAEPIDGTGLGRRVQGRPR